MREVPITLLVSEAGKAYLMVFLKAGLLLVFIVWILGALERAK